MAATSDCGDCGLHGGGIVVMEKPPIRPDYIRQRAIAASEAQDAEAALKVCDLIRSMDLFLGRRIPFDLTKSAQLLENYYTRPCQKCGELIVVGANVQWVRGLGSWHPECYDKAYTEALAARRLEQNFREGKE